MAEQRRDIFDNQEIGLQESAATSFAGVENNSKSTAIAGLQYAEPLVATVVEKMATSGQDDIKSTNLFRARQDLIKLEKSSRMKGGIDKRQLRLSQHDVINRYIAENPSMAEDFDKLVTGVNNTYGFGDEDEGVKAARDQYNKDYQAALGSNLLSQDEQDPNVIDIAVQQVRSINGNAQMLKTASDKLAYTNAQISAAKSQMEFEDFEADANVKKLQRAQQVQQYGMKSSSNALVLDLAPSIDSQVEGLIAGAKNATNKEQYLMDLLPQLERMKVDVTNRYNDTLNGLGGVTLLPADDRTTQLARLTSSIDAARASILNKDGISYMENAVTEANARKTYNIYRGPEGEELVNLAVARKILGDNAATSAASFKSTLNLLTGDNSFNQDGTKNMKSLFTIDARKNASPIYSNTLKMIRDAKAYDPQSSEQANRDIYQTLGTILTGLKPPEDGTPTDPVAIQESLKFFSREDVGNWMVKNQPKFSEESRQRANYVIRKSYSTPIFNGLRETLTKDLGGKPLAEQINFLWQDGGVKFTPKSSLSPERYTEVNKYLTDLNRDKAAKLTQLIRAQATLNNSNDFAGTTATFQEQLYGASNANHNPHIDYRGTDPLTTYVRERRQVAATSKNPEQAVALFDKRNNASPEWIKRANNFESEQRKGQAKDNLDVELLNEEANQPEVEGVTPSQEEQLSQISVGDLRLLRPDLESELEERATIMKRKGASQEMIDEDATRYQQDLVDNFNRTGSMEVRPYKKGRMKDLQ